MTDTSVAEAPASGPLSIDQAIAGIMARGPEADAPSEPQDQAEAAPETDEQPAEGADTQPGGEQDQADAQAAETPDAAETPSETGEDAEQPEPELPAIEPPHFWAAEDKAAFAELPRHLQEKVAAHEKQRNDVASKAIQQAREAEKTAAAAKEAHDREASALADLKARVDKLAPEAESAFKERWGDNPDWSAFYVQCVQQYGPEQGLQQYNATRATYDTELQTLQGLRAAKQDADARTAKATEEAKQRELDAHAAFVQAEAAKLPSVDPELAHPTEGPKRLQALGTYLARAGIPVEQLKGIGAIELALAHKAMKYDLAQAAAAKAAKQPQTSTKPPPQVKPPLKPSSAPAVASTPQRSRQEADGRFFAKPTTDNAVAAILARSKG